MTDSFNADQSVTPSPAKAGGTFSETPAVTPVEFEVDGRKYTVEAAVKKIQNGDQHIQTLESENKTQRETLAAAADEIKRLKGLAEVLARKQEIESDDTKTSIDPDEIARKAAGLVKGTLDEDARIQRENQNLVEVRQSLTKKYGQSVDEIVAKVIEPLGMTKAEAMALAKSKPKAFLAYFERVPTPSPMPTVGNINTQGVKAEQTPTKRTVFDAKTEKERAAIYQERLAQKLKELSGAA